MTAQHVPFDQVFSKAIGRDLRGFVMLGPNTGILLVFEGGLAIELRSLREIEASETDPEPREN